MEGTGIVWKLRETGRIHRPELDGNELKRVEHTGNYCIVQGPGSVNPYSYPCRHVRASDLWCRRRRDVKADAVPDRNVALTKFHGVQMCA